MIVVVEGRRVVIETPAGNVELTAMEAHALALALLSAVVEADHAASN
jgi:hypothetical protein